MSILRTVVGLAFVFFLTLVTQTGGLVFLISLLAFPLIDKGIRKRLARLIAKGCAFVTLYLVFTLGITPFIAEVFGRVALPLSGNLKPANVWTCLLNRNYVTPELHAISRNVAETMAGKFPGTRVNYLDANFPFIDGFPLFPHLSHNDGKKLDLSFQYNDVHKGNLTNDIPSFIGYGICEEPKAGEENRPEYCAQKGHWQYNLLQTIVSQDNKIKFRFDNTRTKALVNSFASHEEVGKIFIEPHLKTRLNLINSKIRFHGCQAVRHDDHIHVQLR